MSRQARGTDGSVRFRRRIWMGLTALIAAAAISWIDRGDDATLAGSADPDDTVPAERRMNPPAAGLLAAHAGDSSVSGDRLARPGDGLDADALDASVARFDRADVLGPPEREEADSDDPDEHRAVPIVLNRLSLEPGDVSIGLTGVDVHGPRDLVAWRIAKGQHVVIARGSSDRAGEIHFPEIIAPRDGLEIVVTDANSTPKLPGGSLARALPGRLPSAPGAVVLGADRFEYALRVVPSEATGEILLADVDGRVFARYPVSTTPTASNRVLDVTLELRPDDTAVLVAHQFGDGRRSDWTEVALETPDGG
jgi:hypothetical protein